VNPRDRACWEGTLSTKHGKRVSTPPYQVLCGIPGSQAPHVGEGRGAVCTVVGDERYRFRQCEPIGWEPAGQALTSNALGVKRELCLGDIKGWRWGRKETAPRWA